jgi:hypothetical protein
MLGLSEIVHNLVGGRPSTSAEDWKVPTNPVHVSKKAAWLVIAEDQKTARFLIA